MKRHQKGAVIMKIETKVSYTTFDGQEFTDKVSAKDHEELIQAKSDYESSKVFFAKLLWQTQKTKDGLPFKLGVFKDYFYVNEYENWPAIYSIGFCRSARYDLDEDDVFCIWQKRNNSEIFSKYRISELFSSKKAAEECLKQAKTERLEELRKECE
jgi:hypothetical protein